MEATQLLVVVCSGRYGISNMLVKHIRSAWRVHEIVRLTIASPWKDNMQELVKRLERKTGGIVLDRAGKFMWHLCSAVLLDMQLRCPSKATGCTAGCGPIPWSSSKTSQHLCGFSTALYVLPEGALYLYMFNVYFILYMCCVMYMYLYNVVGHTNIYMYESQEKPQASLNSFG